MSDGSKDEEVRIKTRVGEFLKDEDAMGGLVYNPCLYRFGYLIQPIVMYSAAITNAIYRLLIT